MAQGPTTTEVWHGIDLANKFSDTVKNILKVCGITFEASEHTLQSDKEPVKITHFEIYLSDEDYQIFYEQMLKGILTLYSRHSDLKESV